MGFLKNVANAIGKVTSAVGAITNPVGSLIGLGTSLLENKSNRDAQAEANQTNMQIAQMNNQYNERMMEKQMAYNTDMWNKENAYNTPAAQMQRLKEAGLNPAMFMGQGNTGQASGALGVSPPTAQAATMQAYNSGGSITAALNQGLQFDLANARQEEEIKTLQQNRQIQAFQTMVDASNKFWEDMDRKEKVKFQRFVNKYADQMQYWQMEDRKVNTQLRQEELKRSIVETANIDKRISLDLQIKGAELALLVFEGKMTKNEGYKRYFSMLEQRSKADKANLDAEMIRQSWDDLLSITRNKSHAQNGWQIFGNFLRMFME